MREVTISGYVALDHGYHNILIWRIVIFYYDIYCLLSVNFHAFKTVNDGLYLTEQMIQQDLSLLLVWFSCPSSAEVIQGDNPRAIVFLGCSFCDSTSEQAILLNQGERKLQ